MWGYLEYREGCSVRWGDTVLLSTVGDNMIHVGEYHEYHGGVQYCGGTQITKDFFPTVLNIPHGTHDIPYMHHDIPTVLSIPHGTQDYSQGTHDIQHGTQHILPHA